MLGKLLGREEPSISQREAGRANGQSSWVPPGTGAAPSFPLPSPAPSLPSTDSEPAAGVVERTPSSDDVDVITSADSLPLFTRKMYDDDLVRMPPSIRQKVCPIEVTAPGVEGNKRGKFAVICTADFVADDYVEELRKR